MTLVPDPRSTPAGAQTGADGCETQRAPPSNAVEGFRHESLFYSGEDEFLAGTLEPIEQAIELAHPVLVAVAPQRISLLRRALGWRASRVNFLDMHLLGRNPARIIPAWQQFLQADEDAGRVLGIGEPVWPGRNLDELDECQRHESLLNLAFGGGRAWRLLCPYDVDGLDDEVIAAAHHSHPYIIADSESVANSRYAHPDGCEAVFAGRLPRARAPLTRLTFSREQLGEVRVAAARYAADAGLGTRRTEELVLAISELMSNSVRHGGGSGTASLWREGDSLMCDVADHGRMEAALAGRIRPRSDQLTGRGLWLANQLCDLVQIRSGSQGTVVRLHMSLLGAGSDPDSAPPL
jgi:anti-sigma regulatory factor (Ser/Thr protein kinase)